MTLRDLLLKVRPDVRMRIVFNAYGHEVEIVKTQESIVNNSYDDFLNHKIDEIYIANGLLDPLTVVLYN